MNQLPPNQKYESGSKGMQAPNQPPNQSNAVFNQHRNSLPQNIPQILNKGYKQPPPIPNIEDNSQAYEPKSPQPIQEIKNYNKPNINQEYKPQPNQGYEPPNSQQQFYPSPQIENTKKPSQSIQQNDVYIPKHQTVKYANVKTPSYAYQNTQPQNTKPQNTKEESHSLLEIPKLENKSILQQNTYTPPNIEQPQHENEYKNYSPNIENATVNKPKKCKSRTQKNV